MGLSFGNAETADFAPPRPVPFVSGGAPTGEYRWSRHHHAVVQAARGGGLAVRPPCTSDRGVGGSMEDGIAAPRSAEAGMLDVTAAAARSGSHRQVRERLWRLPGALPLLALLAVQAALSARLFKADTAF